MSDISSEDNSNDDKGDMECTLETAGFTIEKGETFCGIDPVQYFEKGTFSPLEIEQILKNPPTVKAEFKFVLTKQGKQ